MKIQEQDKENYEKEQDNENERQKWNDDDMELIYDEKKNEDNASKVEVDEDGEKQ